MPQTWEDRCFAPLSTWARLAGMRLQLCVIRLERCRSDDGGQVRVPGGQKIGTCGLPKQDPRSLHPLGIWHITWDANCNNHLPSDSQSWWAGTPRREVSNLGSSHTWTSPGLAPKWRCSTPELVMERMVPQNQGSWNGVGLPRLPRQVRRHQRQKNRPERRGVCSQLPGRSQ